MAEDSPEQKVEKSDTRSGKFVIARKMVTPGLSGFELLLGTAAFVALIVVRFYYLNGKRGAEVVARSEVN